MSGTMRGFLTFAGLYALYAIGWVCGRYDAPWASALAIFVGLPMFTVSYWVSRAARQ